MLPLPTEANTKEMEGGKKKKTGQISDGKGSVGHWRLLQSSELWLFTTDKAAGMLCPTGFQVLKSLALHHWYHKGFSWPKDKHKQIVILEPFDGSCMW